MATKNDITGDSIKTGSTSSAYRDGWDRIFNKDDTEEGEEKPEEIKEDECDT